MIRTKIAIVEDAQICYCDVEKGSFFQWKGHICLKTDGGPYECQSGDLLGIKDTEQVSPFEFVRFYRSKPE
jgi:hypothetical protein